MSLLNLLEVQPVIFAFWLVPWDLSTIREEMKFQIQLLFLATDCMESACC